MGCSEAPIQFEVTSAWKSSNKQALRKGWWPFQKCFTGLTPGQKVYSSRSHSLTDPSLYFTTPTPTHTTIHHLTTLDITKVVNKANPAQRKKIDSNPISTTTASLLLVFYALSYFLPFYLSPLTRPSPTLSRDNPSVIRARIRSVCISCFCCCLSTFLILLYVADLSVPDALHYLGLWPLGLTESARAVSLTALLFAGPLFLYLVVDDGWKDWVKGYPVKELWGDMLTWRNIVAVSF